MAGLLVLQTDIHTLGLEAAQGLPFTKVFYWDENDETRTFSARFAARHGETADHVSGRRDDGRMRRDMYLMQAKKPANRKGSGIS